MDNDPNTLREAARLMSELLASSFQIDYRRGTQLYVWERKSLEWLQRQLKRDPDTPINLYVARYVDEIPDRLL